MATYYINADTGNDGNSGASGSPWLTFNHANNTVHAGDTVICQKSMAAFSFVNLDNRVAQITLKAANYGDAVFEGSGGSVSWIITVDAIVEFDNLIFQNVALGGNNQSVFWTVGSSSYVWTFNGCAFKNFSVDGVYEGIFGAGGSSGSGTTNLIGCLIDDFFVTTQNAPYQAICINNNTAETFNMTNCTIDLRTAGGFNIQYLIRGFNGQLTWTLKNVIIRNATGATVNMAYTAGTYPPIVTATYSDFYLVTGSPSGTGVITSDPLFVDPSNHNFNLRPTSPCIDTGVLV